MGLFNFFNRKNTSTTSTTTFPEIPEQVFIEKTASESPGEAERNGSTSSSGGISVLYEFLEKNYEAKGYDDALVNPDTTHLGQNVDSIKNDLERITLKVRTFYEDFIREIDYHISSRTRSGMIDTVEELLVKKETAEKHIRQVIEIESMAKNDEGVGHGIVLSYTRGFKNGLAAISHHKILRINI